MNRGTQIKLRQLGIIIMAWMLMGFMMSVYDHLLLLTSSTLGPSQEYSFAAAVIRNMGAGLVGALLGGSMLVFYVNVKFQDKPYAYTIFIVSGSFILIILIITLLIGLIAVPIRTGRPLTDSVTQKAFFIYLKDSSHLKAAIFWSCVVGTTQLLLQVNSKFGYGDFWNIIRGRYNTPREEKRIFMFLDINTSTTIAEKLGDETYHALLKDFFADITKPILDNKGNIYQYVGDEVVVAWKYPDGIEDMHSIKCFFDAKLHMLGLREKYMQRYGLFPTFKAGIHCGRVIAGEIGIIKRDITYSGDVLNTTSRILGKCVEFQEEIIASSELLSEMRHSTAYVTRPLGVIKLKGKEKEIGLNALVPANRHQA